MDAKTVSRLRTGRAAVERVSASLLEAIDASLVAVPELVVRYGAASDVQGTLFALAARHGGVMGPLAREGLARWGAFARATAEAERMIVAGWAGHETPAKTEIRDDLVLATRAMTAMLDAMLRAGGEGRGEAAGADGRGGAH